MRETTRGARYSRSRRAGPATALVAAAALTMAGGGDAMGQRADCEVIGPAAEAVCSSPELSTLAREAQDAFREVVRSAPREYRPEVMRDQRDWSLGLGRCLDGGGADECLRQAYEERISVLVEQVSGQTGDNRLTVAPPGPVEQRTLPAPEGAEESGSFAERREATVPDTEEPDSTAGAAPEAADDGSLEAGGEEEPGAERGGDVRTAVRDAGEPEPPEESETSAILTATVWKAEVASGIRPGTIFVFNDDGRLVTADCVKSYRLGTWTIDADGKLVMNEGDETGQTARIIGIRDRFVRLQMEDGPDGPDRNLVLRPAVAPFSCKSG